jgi:glutamine amidotransferase
MISIVDYGMGNLRSVEKALELLGFPTRFVTTPAEVREARKLVLPGVGAFGDAMKGLEAQDLVEPLREYAAGGRPLLGICIGLQVFFEWSEEAPGIPGLGIMKGGVRRITGGGLKIPHMGWNRLEVRNGARVLAGLGDSPYVYFVHSYHVVPSSGSVIAATMDYGSPLVAAVEDGAVAGTQFHPEKSQQVGLHILRNFGEL